MSDQEVDLDALIQSDRRRKHEQRIKKRQQSKKQRRDRYQSRRDYPRDRSRDDLRDQRRDERRDERRDRRRNYPEDRENYRNRRRTDKPQRQLVVESYAISATGFVSDVSLDDILKLAKGKKVINIKAFLERQDGEPLEPGKDNAMTVIINFVQKSDADQFIKEYTDKKLDGKTPLVFQFRRGIVSRRAQQRREENSQNESESKQVQRKSQKSNKNRDN